ncbi:MAG TPA: hypothetical protein VEI83_12180 [Acidimicrobiales bacterium]|nr:hypothetical protein [Acidimicrobiales bacterium]
MAQPGDQRSVEHDIHDLKESLSEYAGGDAHPSSKVVADLTKAIHDIGDHLVALHQRIERLEETNKEWTTRGWEPPPGADRSPGGTV